MKIAGTIWLLTITALRKFFTDGGLFLASALAFNLLLYFIPLSLLMISLLGYTVLDSERAMDEVQSALKAFLPESQQPWPATSPRSSSIAVSLAPSALHPSSSSARFCSVRFERY